MVWHKLYFNCQNIERRTNRAVLVKCPKRSTLKGKLFWHPAKFVRVVGGGGYSLSLSFTDNWEFRTTDGETLTVESVRAAFRASDEDIRLAEAEYEAYLCEEYNREIEPDPIRIEHVEVPECLRN
jgi:hypothetical protein